MLGATLAADAYLRRIQQELDRIDQRQLERWADLVYSAWENSKFVYIIGNGGSGTTASHMSEDLGKSTLRESDLQDYRSDQKRPGTGVAGLGGHAVVRATRGAAGDGLHSGQLFQCPK